MNPRAMKQAMKRMGIKEEPIDSYEVIIKTKDKNLVIRNPQVSKINMMGQETIQVVGNIEEESVISEEDIKTVAEQANVSEEDARKVLEETSGDLAEAILKLQNK